MVSARSILRNASVSGSRCTTATPPSTQAHSPFAHSSPQKTGLSDERRPGSIILPDETTTSMTPSNNNHFLIFHNITCFFIFFSIQTRRINFLESVNETSKGIFLLVSFTDSYTPQGGTELSPPQGGTKKSAAFRKQHSVQLFSECGVWKISSVVDHARG